MAHEALVGGLNDASGLNVTQYRVLTKLLQAGKPFGQGRLGELLGLKPNVVTQAVDALEREGLAVREPGPTDGRTRTLSVTEKGAEHVRQVNDAIVASLYERFPTANPTYRTILEAAVAAAAQIEPPLSKAAANRFPATRSLVSIELIRAETERTLKQATGASFNECRIVQRLGETDRPERIGELAEFAAPVAGQRRPGRGPRWRARPGRVRRLKSPKDKKAVFVGLTEEGIYESYLISATVNELAATKLWANLTPEQRRAIEQVGHVVVADLEAQRQAKEQADFDLLQEM